MLRTMTGATGTASGRARIRRASPARGALLAGAALAGAALLFAGCAAPQEAGAPQATTPDSPAPQPTAVQPVGEPTVLAQGLTTPWSVVRLASGSSLISERDTGLVKELLADGTVREVGEVPGVVPGGEGGLMGLAVEDAIAAVPADPSSAADTSDDAGAGTDGAWLYVFFTAASDNRIVRIALEGDAGSYGLGAVEEVLTGMPKAGNHNGGRIKFGPDGMLYATAGDASEADIAQDAASLGGKILRMTPTGAIPDDNPFAGSPVYSIGHRNPQGIAWDASGQLWAAEFGQNTWDEFNRIEAGGNYGWPEVEGAGGVEGFIDPVYQWPTAEASPSGLLFTSETFFLAALRGERVWALYAEGDTASAVPWFAGDHGRIRDVAEGPDGSLWLLTSNTDANGDNREGADELVQYALAPIAEG